MGQQLASKLAELEKKYESGKWFSFNHISELYLYEYYFEDADFHLSEEPMNRLYQELGSIYKEKKEEKLALEAYEKAIKWNPVDLDAHFARIELEKKLGSLEKVKEHTLEIYPFLCSRATMAHFYRNLGYYYIETYQPELAVMLYTYSSLFFETENAKSEIAYLEKALNRAFPEYEISYLQEKLHENGIPGSAPSKTLGLLYEVGRSEEQKKHIQEATDCFLMVYDLTQDEEVKERLKNLTS